MLKLKFNLRHQDIQLVNKGAVVATDSKDYLVAKFNTISNDWEAPLTAVFTDDKHKQPYAVIVGADERLAEDECFVPWEVLTDVANVYVSVYCGNLHTTITSAFKVRKSGYIEGETPPPPSPTVYDIIMQAITDLQVGKQDKLTAGENITIDENDGTISAEGGVTSYVDLENKPQINGHELVGNKTGDDLGLQNKLTAGENVTINANGEISANGGVTSYNDLTDKPTIDGYIIGNLRVSSGLTYRQSTGYGSLSVNSERVLNSLSGLSDNIYDGSSLFGFQNQGLKPIQLPNDAIGVIFQFRNDRNFYDEYGQYKTQILQHKIFFSTETGEMFLKLDSKINGEKTNIGQWRRVGGSQIVSGVVNQDGTITFTMSDGSTVTTKGQSVIGPQGPAGADGNDYVLTAQDKTDIANIVLSELPTTQGVLYGNTSN